MSPHKRRIKGCACTGGQGKNKASKMGGEEWERGRCEDAIWPLSAPLLAPTYVALSTHSVPQQPVPNAALSIRYMRFLEGFG